MNFTRQQKRQVIDCTQHQFSNNNNQDGRRAQSTQDLYSTKKALELTNLKTLLENNPLQRVNLKSNTSYSQYSDQQMFNEKYPQGFKTPQQEYKLPTTNLIDNQVVNDMQSKQNNFSRYDWMKDSNIDSNIMENQNQLNMVYLSSQNSYSNALNKDKVSTGSLIMPQKFQSLNNIDTPLQNDNQREKLNLICNKGRYVVHQKVKQSIEQNQLSSTFFTTPQYKTSKAAQSYSLQELQRFSTQIQKNTFYNSKQTQQSTNITGEQIPCDQYDPQIDDGLTKTLRGVDKTTSSQQNNQSDKINQPSTATATDQPDSSSSQDDTSLKQINLGNILDDNIIDEIKNQPNDKERDKISNQQVKYDWNDNNLVKVRKAPIVIKQSQKLELNNNFMNRLGSLSFLDEQDGNSTNNKSIRQYNAASYTKLPSTCQLGKFNKLSLSSLNQIKSAQDMSKEQSIIDEKKMMEDYRQYQLRNKLDIKSRSVAVYDLENNQFILSLKGQRLSQIASLTKIMTCYIVCDLLNKVNFKKHEPIKVTLRQNQIIRISKIAAKMKGTSALLRNGDQLTLWSLLHGLMLPSGNDAAFAISEQIGSLIYESYPIFQSKKFQNPSLQNCNPKAGQKEFIRVMNLYADKLKLKNTFYSNPHGLSNNKNKSCANDICILISHAMKNNYFREIVKTTEYTASIQNSSKGSREITWENTNKLLKSSKYCIGVKTGITPAAGPCLSSCFSINNRNFIIVVLNTLTMETRFSESLEIFKFIVELYELNKEKEDISKDLTYQSDQNNIIEQKYLKQGWEITSNNNVISTDELEEKYSSDEYGEFNDDDDDQEYDEDDDDNTSNNFDFQQSDKLNQGYYSGENEADYDKEINYSLNHFQENNNSKIQNQNNLRQEYYGKIDKFIQPSINSITSSETFSESNLQNQALSNQQRVTNQIQINKREQEDENKFKQQNQQFNLLLNGNFLTKNNNCDEKDTFNKQEEQTRHNRNKKLSKICEEDF